MSERTPELEFMSELMIALGQHPSLTIWRQNCGKIPIRDRAGKVVRKFDAGPPNGAADISGYVKPEGWRVEIEVKAADGKQSKAQQIFERNVTDGGCIYVLVAFDEALGMRLNLKLAVEAVEKAIWIRKAIAC